MTYEQTADRVWFGLKLLNAYKPVLVQWDVLLVNENNKVRRYATLDEAMAAGQEHGAQFHSIAAMNELKLLCGDDLDVIMYGVCIRITDWPPYW